MSIANAVSLPSCPVPRPAPPFLPDSRPSYLLVAEPLFAVQVGLYQIDAVDEYELPKALSQTIATAFDLAKGPLVRATLIPLANTQEHVLVVNMHYAVADGWSLGVLFKDISSCYNGLKRSTGDTLACAPHTPYAIHYAALDLQCGKVAEFLEVNTPISEGVLGTLCQGFLAATNCSRFFVHSCSHLHLHLFTYVGVCSSMLLLPLTPLV